MTFSLSCSLALFMLGWSSQAEAGLHPDISSVFFAETSDPIIGRFERILEGLSLRTEEEYVYTLLLNVNGKVWPVHVTIAEGCCHLERELLDEAFENAETALNTYLQKNHLSQSAFVPRNRFDPIVVSIANLKPFLGRFSGPDYTLYGLCLPFEVRKTLILIKPFSDDKFQYGEGVESDAEGSEGYHFNPRRKRNLHRYILAHEILHYFYATIRWDGHMDNDVNKNYQEEWIETILPLGFSGFY